MPSVLPQSRPDHFLVTEEVHPIGLFARNDSVRDEGELAGKFAGAAGPLAIGRREPKR
jgi:hypothetical protein